MLNKSLPYIGNAFSINNFIYGILDVNIANIDIHLYL
jgi:hypothetical protein